MLIGRLGVVAVRRASRSPQRARLYVAVAAALMAGLWYVTASPADFAARHGDVTMLWWIAASSAGSCSRRRHRANGLAAIAGLLVAGADAGSRSSRLSPAATATAASCVLFVLLLVWAADTGAYFAGRRFGRAASWRRASARARPGKACSAACCAGARRRARRRWPGFDLPTLAVRSRCASRSLLVSIVGDLTREHVQAPRGLKDSGTCSPATAACSIASTA